MKPDPEIMDRFLSHLFGNELRGLVELAWRDPKRSGQYGNRSRDHPTDQ